MNAQADHIHLQVKVPPKLSISELMEVLKGRTAIRSFSAFSFMRKKPYWSNYFQAKGYCVDTVGLNGEMIQKYVKFQEKGELYQEQLHQKRTAKPRCKNVVNLL